MELLPKDINCQETEKPALAIMAAMRQPRPIGPAKKLAEKISAKIKAAPMMIQMSQSISTVSIFVYRGVRVNQRLCRMSFTGFSAFLRIFKFSSSTTTAKAMAK